MITEEQAKKDIQELLEYIGDDPTREGLKATPDRMLRMLKEMFRGYDPAQKPIITTFPNGQDGIIYDNMVIDNGPFYSVCEHHCRTFFGEYWFAYIPNKHGRILGLSKLAVSSIIVPPSCKFKNVWCRKWWKCSLKLSARIIPHAAWPS